MTALSTINARIDFYCKPLKKNSSFQIETIFLELVLPFVPEIGTMLKVAVDDDYYEVDNIYFDATAAEPVVHVGLAEPEEDELTSWQEMRRRGWKRN